MKLNILFLSFLLGSASLQAMINKESPVIEEFSVQEIELIINKCQNEIPRIIKLFDMQESLCNVLESYISNKISSEQFSQTINQIDHFILSQCGSLKKLEPRIKFCLDPLLNYSQKLQNFRALNGRVPFFVLDQKAAIISNEFLEEYKIIRKFCKPLHNSLAQSFNGSFLKPSSQQEHPQADAIKNATDLITRDELGFNKDLSDENFLNLLHNICITLEVQEICSEIISLRAFLLKKAMAALENYMQTIEKTDLIERAGLPAEELPLGKGPLRLKPLKTAEAYYMNYSLNTSSRNPNQFDTDYVGSFLNVANDEVKKLAQMALAKSDFDLFLDQYIQLVQLFMKLKQLDSVEFLSRDYQQALRSNAQLLIKQIKFFPCTLFDFDLAISDATDILNTSYTFGSKIKALESNIKITEKFISEYQEKKEIYSRIYKRLKKTLRIVAPKCPSSRLREEKKYLAGLSLDCYSLSSSQLLAPQEATLISLLRKKKSEKIIEPTSQPVLQVQEPSKIASTTSKVEKVDYAENKKKKSRERREKQKLETTLASSPPQALETKPVAAAMANLNLNKNENKKNDVKNIFLQNKKIARRIVDEKNAMIIHLFRLKDNDPAAPKIMNYDDRVQLWFSNPKAALEQKNFANGDPRKLNSVAFHSFPKEIDKYALKWGFKRKSHNKDTKEVDEILIPGTIDKNGKRYEGLFTYVIDSKYLCYHRFFSECDWRNKLESEWEVRLDE